MEAPGTYSLTFATTIILAWLFAPQVVAQDESGKAPPASVGVDKITIKPLLQTAPVIGRLVERQSGEVAARINGPVGILNVDVGDRVAVETMLSCRFCDACLAGSYHLCHTRQIYSYIPLEQGHGLWGAYSEFMVLDGRSIVHKVDPALPPETAVMFNPLGAGFRWAVEIPQTGPGDTVLILGPGQRGLASVLACREAGAEKIFVTGLAADAKKLALARQFGADAAIDVENENVRERVRELTDGRGADVVVDVSAYALSPVTEALDCVRPGGTVVLAGVKGFKPVPDFVSDKIVLKEITLRGAIGVTSSGYRSAIKLLEGRRHPVEKMHTHEFGLRNAELAIRTLAREVPGEGSIHSCLIPGKD